MVIITPACNKGYPYGIRGIWNCSICCGKMKLVSFTTTILTGNAHSPELKGGVNLTLQHNQLLLRTLERIKHYASAKNERIINFMTSFTGAIPLNYYYLFLDIQR